MAKADYIDLDGNALLAKAFAGWSFNGFDFPMKDVADGCTGEKCISQAVHYFLRRRAPNGTWQSSSDDVLGLLSGHLYFKATCGVIKKSSNTLRVVLKQFHFTIRRSKSQFLIDECGPSILTSKDSIHINRNTDWGRDENIDKLVQALANDLPGAAAFTRAELLDFLTAYRNYTKQHMGLLADELAIEAQIHLQEQVGVTVTVDCDVSFAGR